MGGHLREAGGFAEARAWYTKALTGLEATTNPTERVWRDAWQAEVLWMELEQAKSARGTLSAERQAEFDTIIKSMRDRDPKNPRLVHLLRK